MTTDAFTEAARAYARKRYPTGSDLDRDRRMVVDEFAVWARTYLAAQEPTDAEVLAALNADYALRFGPRNLPADSLEPYGDEHVQIMRAALMAAREARHATDE